MRLKVPQLILCVSLRRFKYWNVPARMIRSAGNLPRPATAATFRALCVVRVSLKSDTARAGRNPESKNALAKGRGGEMQSAGE